MTTIGFFAGASSGSASIATQVEEFVVALADARFDFVFGGAVMGLMGIVERVGLERGRSVTGVIPAQGEGNELYSTRLTKLEVTPSRADRKRRISELSDALIALPGGPGTLEEVTDAWSARQRGEGPPVFLFSPDDFYASLVLHAERMQEAGFTTESFTPLVITGKDIKRLTQQFA